MVTQTRGKRPYLGREEVIRLLRGVGLSRGEANRYIDEFSDARRKAIAFVVQQRYKEAKR